MPPAPGSESLTKRDVATIVTELNAKLRAKPVDIHSPRVHSEMRYPWMRTQLDEAREEQARSGDRAQRATRMADAAVLVNDLIRSGSELGRAVDSVYRNLQPDMRHRQLNRVAAALAEVRGSNGADRAAALTKLANSLAPRARLKQAWRSVRLSSGRSPKPPTSPTRRGRPAGR